MYAAILGYVLLGLIFHFSISADIFFDLSFVLLFFALAQAFFELGGRRALIFVVLSAAIGFLAEVLGTSTGIPFGKYSYGDLLGPKVLGVPIVVPLVWFVIAYIALSMVEGGVSGRIGSRSAGAFSTTTSAVPEPDANHGRRNYLLIALLAAFGAMSWDLLIDPMFSSYQYWTWDSNQFFSIPTLSGIPLTNFVGWFVIVFLVISAYLLLVPRGGSVLRRRNTIDSVTVYSMLIIDGVIANWSLGHSFVIAIGSAAMIAFILLSLTWPRLLRSSDRPSASTRTSL